MFAMFLFELPYKLTIVITKFNSNFKPSIPSRRKDLNRFIFRKRIRAILIFIEKLVKG